MSLKELYLEFSTLSVFMKLRQDPLFSAFAAIFEEERDDWRLCNYAAFVNNVLQGGGDLSKLVAEKVFEDENVFILNGDYTDSLLKENVVRELAILEKVASLTPTDFKEFLKRDNIATYKTGKIDLETLYFERIKDIKKFGYGIFATNSMFRVDVDGEIQSIKAKDTISLSEFVGYSDERGELISNTVNFLNNRPSFNTLLYGDAGTGKSSSIKAIVNEYAKDGLRLIELRKDQIHLLPMVMDRISANPLKFIIFIDDLSFTSNDETFAMLKAILEGSASSKGENALIYCTSNRRHLVKENFSSRGEFDDDLHRNDTIEETMSLVQRFGLTIAFYKPNKKLYLEIVHELAAKENISIVESELDIKAEQFALAKGSRSPRVAKQFIKSLL